MVGLKPARNHELIAIPPFTSEGAEVYDAQVAIADQGSDEFNPDIKECTFCGLRRCEHNEPSATD